MSRSRHSIDQTPEIVGYSSVQVVFVSELVWITTTCFCTHVALLLSRDWPLFWSRDQCQSRWFCWQQVRNSRGLNVPPLSPGGFIAQNDICGPQAHKTFGHRKEALKKKIREWSFLTWRGLRKCENEEGVKVFFFLEKGAVKFFPPSKIRLQLAERGVSFFLWATRGG